MTMTCILPNGVTIAYTVSGERDAPPMVLLHGGANDHTTWDGVLPSLAQTHHVYALDQRGHGQSSRTDAYSFELMRDDLLGFLDALGLDRVVLVGHSMGGNVAWLFAQDHAERLTRLVIEDVAPNRPGDPSVTIPPRPDDWDRPFAYEALAAVMAQLNDPDPAWTTGGWSMTVPGPDNSRRALHGNYGAVEQREGGAWKIRALTYNVIMNPPPSAQSANK